MSPVTFFRSESAYCLVQFFFLFPVLAFKLADTFIKTLSFRSNLAFEFGFEGGINFIFPAHLSTLSGASAPVNHFLSDVAPAAQTKNIIAPSARMNPPKSPPRPIMMCASIYLPFRIFGSFVFSSLIRRSGKFHGILSSPLSIKLLHRQFSGRGTRRKFLENVHPSG
jgi:hypothetical protein